METWPFSRVYAPKMLLLALAGASTLGPALAQDETVRTEKVNVHQGFVKGAQYLEASEADRRTYIMGLVDGVLSAGLYGASATRVARYQHCLEQMPGDRVESVLFQYLQENQESQDIGVNMSFFFALSEACGLVRQP